MNTDASLTKAGAPRGWLGAMQRLMTSPFLLALVIALSFFWQLGAVPLYDLDEGAFAEATREMLESGNFITPHRDGEPRYDKPALIYWLQAGATEVLGFNELALRLPSALAATLWVMALWLFVRQRLDAPTATLAGVLMALSLEVSLIGRAAVADALLNLFIALTFFEIYRYSRNPDPKVSRGCVLRAYLWMALGFLTKGPIAVFFPVVVSFLFFLSAIRWSKQSLVVFGGWFRAAFAPLGWLIFLLVAGPWYLAIYLDDGAGFFRSFFLNHNLGRFGEAMQGHHGFLGYYLAVLLVMLLPFTGWLLSLVKTYRSAWSDPLDRFLWIWFLTVILFFSFSATKLPHYLLYGATPLFILMARHRDVLTNRWLAFLPPLIFSVLLVALPFILDVAMVTADKPYQAILFEEGRQAIDQTYGAVALAGLVAMVLLLRWARPPLWQRLVLAGIVQALVIQGVLVPRVLDTLQGPVKEAGLLAKRMDLPTVVYRTAMPSFSVYRDAVTPSRAPRPGDLVFLRVDKLERLIQEHPGMALERVYHRGPVVLLRVGPLD